MAAELQVASSSRATESIASSDLGPELPEESLSPISAYKLLLICSAHYICDALVIQSSLHHAVAGVTYFFASFDFESSLLFL